MAFEMQALQGGFDDPPRQASFAFRAAMMAMARPGDIQHIHGGAAPAPCSAAAATLLLTLCDRETPLCLVGNHDTDAMRDWVNFHIGAPIVSACDAQFVLGRWTAVPLSDLPIGTPDYPDRSATVIVEMDELSQTGAGLSGPGIKDRASLNLPDIAFFQDNNALFPLGLDFYFCAGDQLAALPRSTKVEG